MRLQLQLSYLFSRTRSIRTPRGHANIKFSHCFKCDWQRNHFKWCTILLCTDIHGLWLSQINWMLENLCGMQMTSAGIKRGKPRMRACLYWLISELSGLISEKKTWAFRRQNHNSVQARARKAWSKSTEFLSFWDIRLKHSSARLWRNRKYSFLLHFYAVIDLQELFYNLWTDFISFMAEYKWKTLPCISPEMPIFGSHACIEVCELENLLPNI